MAPQLSDGVDPMDDDWTLQQKKDDALLETLLADSMEGNNELFSLDRPLEAGEKADNAEDFEDISDDDLPDEEEATTVNPDAPGLTDDGGTSHDTDDLFGEDGRDTSPFADHEDDTAAVHNEGTSDLHSPEEARDNENQNGALGAVDFDWRAVNFDPAPKDANQDLSIPAPADNEEELVKQGYPGFQQGIILDFNKLLRTRRSYYVNKTPAKLPKPVVPTKVSLDLAADTEKSFRAPGTATLDKHQRILQAEAKGYVPIIEESSGETSDDDFDFSLPEPSEKIGNATWADLELATANWDPQSGDEHESDTEAQDILELKPRKRAIDALDQEWLRDLDASPPPATKEKTSHDTFDPHKFRYVAPSFDDFEMQLERVAKRPFFDPNDPYLLLEEQAPAPPAKRRRVGGGLVREANGNFKKSLRNRFNHSNDEAYDALKENHQSKVRAVVGNFSVEHSLPAQKLQWPYYRVKLSARDARSYHRPSLKFNKLVGQAVTFDKPALRKKKNLKGLQTYEIYKESKDLSLGDNSTALLIEYSEEYPTVLSNFGMGNRIINYYRRKDAEDLYRPKLDIGEPSILLPEDRSPFAKFGRVDPGETVPTIHNGMYRAPVFKHEPKTTDFLVVRNSTGVNGMNWYLRNIDHVYVAGQQFPSVEIPKPSSRKVTTAAKNRMKMLSFRMIKHHPEKIVKIHQITEHIAESTDMQNRQKLKEFMQYNKDTKCWQMKDRETVPDESVIRAMVKPEDVCVIDAMQVGTQHLEDAGFARADDNDDDDEENEGEGLEQKLAPWKTSKNFIEASQNKAMLELHGDGDPSGCGLAFSFIKTSMKGGFLNQKGPSATSADAIAREKKANGGHAYNVDKQNTMYNQAIEEVWNGQKQNLSDPTERDAADMEDPDIDELGAAPTPMSTAHMPGNFDDSASQFSRFSASWRTPKVMRITRKIRRGNHVEDVTEEIRDPRVWREYQKRRDMLDADKTNIYELTATGNPEVDKRKQLQVKKELARLERNKERREIREKQKHGKASSVSVDPEGADSPAATPAPAAPAKGTGTTTRKCANCGQAGHIRTNKKYYCSDCTPYVPKHR